jgi:hypothetical protein
MQLRREGSDGGGSDGGGHDPPRRGAGACYGCGHQRKLPGRRVPYKHHPGAYRSTPHPSHASIAFPDMI